MKLSIIVPTLDGSLPKGLPSGNPEVEVIVVSQVAPVGKARNEGLRRAVGDYIAWVDADDEIEDDWLPQILAAIAHDPDLIVVDAIGIGWQRFFGGAWNAPAGKVAAKKLMRDIYGDGAIAGAMWQFAAKSELWKDLWFDETVQAWEDYLVLPKLCARAKTAWHVKVPVYKYISRPGSLVNTSTPGREDKHLAKIIARADAASLKWRSHAMMATARECYWIWRRSRNAQAWQYVAQHFVFLALWALLHGGFRWFARFAGMVLKVL